MSNDGLFVTQVDLGVQNVHLISGEDIIGRVWLNESKGEYTIERPVMPTMAQDPQTGSYRVGLLPLRPYLPKIKDVVIPRDRVLYTVAVSEQMQGIYTQTVSEIIVPRQGQTLGDILGAK